MVPTITVGAAETRIVRTLTGRSEAVRMRFLESIDPKRNPNSLVDLIEAAKQNASKTPADTLVPSSMVKLIYLIGRFEHVSAEEALTELLDAENSGIAMISADALGKNKKYNSIDALKEQVSRPAFIDSYGFRFNLVRSLAQMEHPDAIEYISELSNQLDGQLRFQLDRVLDEVTVDHFFGDEERFAKWKQRDEEEAEPAAEDTTKAKPAEFFTTDEPSESMNRIGFEQPQYYGIDIHAKRLMFIIDHSGSMKEYWGNYTRLDRAKTELIRAIRELPEETEFAIVFYESGVRMWREELVWATSDNKREAIQFVQRLKYGDRTNTYGALRQSLEFDESLETVFLLTDGRPTTGTIVAPTQIVTDIIHRNRFRHLNFNTIGVAVRGTTETFLRNLAEQTNGEYRSADWSD